ncbi:MAG: hypothetical protein IJA61_04000 [Clostridia bacterium]|nr:hypothetical protein [Clostridia bacterium]
MTKGKKIFIWAVAVVLLAVIATAIILSVVSTEFYNPVIKDVRHVIIWSNGEQVGVGTHTNPDYQTGANGELTQGNKIYNKIMELHNNSVKESVLTNLLGGGYGYEATVTETETAISSITKSDAVVIEFVCANYETLMFNGEEYTDTDDDVVKFNKMYLAVYNTENLSETTLYFVNTDADKNDSNVQIKFLAKQSELYNYILGL